jgi:hypothetical protein
VNATDGMNESADNSAEAEVVVPDERTVSYVFPVEVIVVGALTEEDHRQIYTRVWTDFGDAMAYQNV